MDFYENNEQVKMEQKSKKTMIILGITIIILFLAIIGIAIAISYINNTAFKVYVDQKKIKTASQDTFLIQGEKVYVSIKDFAQIAGYEYNNGEYKYQFSETTDKCYITNGSETASYILDSQTMYKLVIDSTNKDDDFDYEYYDIDEPVVMINNKLYTTLEGISKGCNMLLSYDVQKNTMTIYTLPYLVNYYSSRISDAAISEKEKNFANQKALIYDMIIVKNSSNQYGVINSSKETIIGEKYKSITFIEGTQEFLVKTTDDKFGIIAKDGTTEIEPGYDSIKQIEPELGLYMVSNNSKYGVINRTGKIVIYLEYDSIGVDTTKFPADYIDNKYILYNECIPVQKNKKWGLLDRNGNTVLAIEYDGLGCIMSNSSNSNSLLLVPEYKAIVVQQGKLYGLINSSGELLIPTRVRNMYSITTSGKNDYYLTYDEVYEGQIIDIIAYLKNTLGIQPVN